MATETGFMVCVGILEAGFGPQRRERHKLYEQRFTDVSDADLAAACRRCIDECNTFPTVKDILDRLPGATPQLSSGRHLRVEPWMIEVEQVMQKKRAEQEREEAGLTMEQKVELWLDRTARRKLNRDSD